MSSSDSADRHQRTIDMLGQPGFDRVSRSSVVVVSLGGVGSHAAVALVRADVRRLRLVDHDRVGWSSLNRHATAGPDAVGHLKTEVLGRDPGRLCPDLDVELLARR